MNKITYQLIFCLTFLLALMSFASATSIPQPSNVVSWLSLDETTGNFTADSTGKHNATFQANAERYSGGKIGYGAWFEHPDTTAGNKNRISYYQTNITPIDISAVNFTFNAWTKTDFVTHNGTQDRYPTVLGCTNLSDGLGRQYFLFGFREELSGLMVQYWDGQAEKKNSGYGKNVSYNMLSLTKFANNTWKMYINGGVVMTFNLTIDGECTPEWGGFGNSDASVYWGMLDELAYWNATLTDAEITTLYNSGSGLGFTGVPTDVHQYTPEYSDTEMYMTGWIESINEQDSSYYWEWTPDDINGTNVSPYFPFNGTLGNYSWLSGHRFSPNTSYDTYFCVNSTSDGINCSYVAGVTTAYLSVVTNNYTGLTATTLNLSGNTTYAHINNLTQFFQIGYNNGEGSVFRIIWYNLTDWTNYTDTLGSVDTGSWNLMYYKQGNGTKEYFSTNWLISPSENYTYRACVKAEQNNNIPEFGVCGSVVNFTSPILSRPYLSAVVITDVSGVSAKFTSTYTHFNTSSPVTAYYEYGVCGTANTQYTSTSAKTSNSTTVLSATNLLQGTCYWVRACANYTVLGGTQSYCNSPIQGIGITAVWNNFTTTNESNVFVTPTSDDTSVDSFWATLLGSYNTTLIKTLLGFAIIIAMIIGAVVVFGKYNMQLGTFGLMVVVFIGVVIATLLQLLSIAVLLLILVGGIVLIMVKQVLFPSSGG